MQNAQLIKYEGQNGKTVGNGRHVNRCDQRVRRPFMLTQTLVNAADRVRHRVVRHMMSNELMNTVGGVGWGVQLRAATVSLSTACPGCKKAS